MKKKGYALVLVMIFAAVIMIVGAAVLSNAVNVVKANNYYEKNIDNTNISLESGIELAYSRLQNYVLAGSYNGTDTELTSILDSPNLNVNDKNVQLAITADPTYFYIASNIDGKTMKAKASKISMSTTSSNEATKLNNLVGIIIPSINDIQGYDGGTGYTTIADRGVKSPYNLNGVLRFSEDKLSTIIKSNGDTHTRPSIYNQNVTTVNSVNFKTQPTSPVSDDDVKITIPSHTFVTPQTGSFLNANNGSDGNTKYDSVVLSADKSAVIGSGQYEKYIEGDKAIWYFDNDLEITPAAWNDIVQDLSGVEINCKGTIKIYGSVNNITIKNLTINADSVIMDNYPNKYLEGCKINCNTLKIINPNSLQIKQSTIVAPNIIISTSGQMNFDDVSITTKAFDLGGSNPKTLNKVNLKSNTFTMQLTDGTTVTNCDFTTGTYNISGSVNETFINSNIKADSFNINSSDGVSFKDTMIVANTMSNTGSCDRTFNGCIVVVPNEKISTSDGIFFNESLNITNSLRFYAEGGGLNISAVSNIDTLNDMFKKAQEYVTIDGKSIEAVTSTSFKIGRLEYE